MTFGGRGGTRSGAGAPKKDRDKLMVTLPPVLLATLRSVAESRGVTVSSLVEEALIQYFSEN